MIVELGHFALILAFCVALVQCASPMLGLYARDSRLLKVAEVSAPVLFALIAFSFAALVYAHVVSDFSDFNVYANSHSAKPLLYKISGVWGN
ncbi:MAG: heme lyase NrfEFG subunit NrfE, partial [Rhodomicrobium sp.]